MNSTQEAASGTTWRQASGEAGPQPPPQEGPARVPQPPPQVMPTYRDPRRKSVPLAGVLSAMPGLGQIYVGYYPRGFIHALVAGGIIALMNTGNLEELTPLAGLFISFFWLYNIIDAMRRADLYNRVLEGGKEPELPDDFKLPALGGSIFGGVVLIVGGAILLSHTRFDMPLDWVGDWWPMLPILLGVYLLVKAIMERTATEPPQRTSGEARDADAAGE